VISIEQFLADMATSVSNKALNTDPELQQRLKALDGRIVEIECTAPFVIGHLKVVDGQMLFTSGAAEQPHVRVKGSAPNLLKWLTQREPEDLIIDGDHNILLEFLNIAQSFDPDVENTLTAILGHNLASRAVGTAELGLRGLQSIVQGIGDSIQNSSIPNNTSSQFVKKDEFDTLLDGIDELRLRVDRLSANLRQREGE
jgi:ubiquinone biosynthesis protein UbiJ